MGQLAPPSATSAAAGPTADPHLLLHLKFDGAVDAVVARADGRATVTGTPAYEGEPGARGVRVTKGVQLTYLPEGNVNLQQGRLYLRFKPLWEGADGQTHMLLTVRPAAGLFYLGKLDDGRLVCNMFDAKEGQHYPGHLVRDLHAGTWHDVLVTWDTAKGLMTMYLDGQKVSEHRGEPWQMPALDNKLAHCRLTLPESADAVIGEIKIWDQPY